MAVAGAPYIQGTVAVGTTPVLICSAGPGGGGLVLQTGSGAVFVGGITVTATGVTAGIALPANTIIMWPTSGPPHDLWAVCANGVSSTLAYCYAV